MHEEINNMIAGGGGERQRDALANAIPEYLFSFLALSDEFTRLNLLSVALGLHNPSRRTTIAGCSISIRVLEFSHVAAIRAVWFIIVSPKPPHLSLSLSLSRSLSRLSRRTIQRPMSLFAACRGG